MRTLNWNCYQSKSVGFPAYQSLKTADAFASNPPSKGTNRAAIAPRRRPPKTLRKIVNRPTSSLRNFVITRLLLLPVTLWVVASLLFGLLRILPGDPVDAVLGPRASEAAREAMRQTLGLTGSVWTQYWGYLGQLLRLDLGTSISSTGKPVWGIIGTFFPASVELAIAGLMVSLVLAVPLGLLAATRPGTPIDTATRTSGILTYAIPVFWIGMLFQLIFGVYLRWFPIGSRLPTRLSPPPRIHRSVYS